MQEYLDGKDVNVGAMEKVNEGIWILPISEENYDDLPPELPKICGFESKWDESSPYYLIKTKPTTLSKEHQEFISDCSRRLFERIECKDYAVH